MAANEEVSVVRNRSKAALCIGNAREISAVNDYRTTRKYSRYGSATIGREKSWSILSWLGKHSCGESHSICMHRERDFACKER